MLVAHERRLNSNQSRPVTATTHATMVLQGVDEAGPSLGGGLALDGLFSTERLLTNGEFAMPFVNFGVWSFSDSGCTEFPEVKA